MGNVSGIYASYFGSPDISPNINAPPTFDAQYGFTHGRKERRSLVTEEQMEAAGIPPEQRDYCAHLLIDFLKCRKEKFPWVVGCKHEKHAWDTCEYEDFVLRMKEYEREKRLLERAKKLKQRQRQSEVLVE